MGRYEDALKALNPAQRRAVETIDGPVLVIAGPGTGKTQLLTTRIAHILAVTDTLPQNILCLTFTDSAAQTMQERLSGMIGQGAYDVTISTYHAFGSELIRRFPDYFTDDAGLEPIDDLGIDSIFRAIIARLPYRNPLKYADAYVSDIKTLVSDAKRALLTPDDLRATATENLAFIEKVSPLIAKTLAGVARIDKKSLPLFAKILEGTAGGEHGEVLLDKTRTLPLAEQFRESLAEALEVAEASGKTASITAWKNAWLAKDANGNFTADGRAVNQKLLAAADVYETYLAELKARQLYDYDDMILRAVRALESNADLRYTLQEQYQYILLDEFQDTNGAQLRIVELLTDNPVNEGRPNVLAVGDDDQAIYAFQGANYSHMLQFKQMYRDVVAIPLTENYRSHTDILHTARGIAEQVEERLHHHFPDIEKTLVARADIPNVVVERREAASDVMQFAWISRRISELIRQGIPADEIAVLAPQHKYLVPLVPFLQEAGVPVRYEKRENILEDPGIIELVRMAELALALGQGNQRTASALWAQVLSFDFWQLPTSRIWQLAWQANDENQTWTDKLLADPQLKPVALFFIRLGQLSATETLETMLDYLIGSAPLDLREPDEAEFTSPYYEHYFGTLTDPERANFWELLNNLIVLRAKLRAHKKDETARLHLADLIGFIEAHNAANLKILNTSPYASGTEAVQLMTAYKAKGMEFAAVFVLAVNDEAWGGKSRSQGNRISLPPNLQYIRYKGSNDDERLRLFYVAVTRAKTQLYLVNYTSNYAGKSMTRLKYLNESAGEAGIVSPLLPAATQIVLPAEEDTPAPTTELAAYWQTRHAEALSGDDVRALLQDRLQSYQLSPTHLGDFIDLVNCGPHGFFLRTILRFPQAPRPEVAFGNAMHETLEWLHLITKRDGLLPSAPALKKTFGQRLHAKQLNEADTQLFLERGLLALSAFTAQRAATVTPDSIVEYNFRNEGVFIGKAHLGGKIDKLLVDKENKTITIVDYKTGKAHARWSREVKLHKYRQQLYFYKLLVEGSHTYAGYTVTDAYLEFIEPDEDGNILELHVTFDEQETARLKQLIQAVWLHIKAVDLPDISSYKADLGGVEAFEADLIRE